MARLWMGLVGAILGITLLATTAAATDLSDLAGTWDVRLTGRRGPQVGLLKIQPNGDATLVGNPVDLNIIDGKKIAFDYSRASFFGGKVNYHFTGRLSYGRMDGSAVRLDKNDKSDQDDSDKKGDDSDKKGPPPSSWYATRLGTNPGPLDFSGVWSRAGSLGSGGWQPQHPGLTPAGKARVDKFTEFDMAALRCDSVGLGKLFSWPYLLQIVRAEHHPLYVFLYEGESAIRRIYLDGRSFPDYPSEFEGPMGYSVGHIDGRTLTIKTKNLTPSLLDTSMHLHQIGKKATIVEHYTLTDDGRFIIADLTVTAPLTIKQPITKHRVLARSNRQVAPYDCDPYSFFRQLHREGQIDKYFNYDFVLDRF